MKTRLPELFDLTISSQLIPLNRVTELSGQLPHMEWLRLFQCDHILTGFNSLLLRKLALERIPALKDLPAGCARDFFEVAKSVSSTTPVDARWIPGWRFLLQNLPSLKRFDSTKLIEHWNQCVYPLFLFLLCAREIGLTLVLF